MSAPRRPAEDSIGERFGLLVVTGLLSGLGKKRVKAQCDCGNTWEGTLNTLRRGNTKSCGCYFLQQVTSHGMSDHPLYHIWDGIIKRTTRPSHDFYKDYGGRGITIWPEWAESPKAFITWVLENLGPRPSDNHSIDRINNDTGSYEPGNLQWSTQEEQCNNKRGNVLLEYRGEVKTQAQWAKATGLSSELIAYRLQSGWSIGDALTWPIGKPRSEATVEFQGETRKLKDLCDLMGMDYLKVKARINAGWDIHRALTTPIGKYVRHPDSD